MNVVVYGPYGGWSPHFEIELEFLQIHLDQGDEVTYITCDTALSFCEFNPKHEYDRCLHCYGRVREGIKHLSGPVRVLKLSDLYSNVRQKTKALAELPAVYSSYEHLNGIRVEGFDLGAAVLSTLNSYLNDPEPDPSDHPEIVRAMVSSAYVSFFALDHYLETNPCDLFYVLNGRLSNFRAALRACQKRKVKCMVHERGSDLNSFRLAENTMPHDPVHTKALIKETLAKVKSTEEKELVAEQFYQERSAGKIANWLSYTEEQQKGLLPDGWLGASVRIAAFSSTESEFAALKEFFRPDIYPSQCKGYEAILHDLAQNNFAGKFVLRMHPNSAGTKSDFTEDIRRLGYPFVTVLAPDEKYDSYALLKSAHKVLTFGSTIGIEAAYWGIPSILARYGLYEDFGSTYNPSSHQEIMNLLRFPIDPKSRAGAIDYGFFCRTFGAKLKYVKPIDTFYCTFKGVLIQPGDPYRKILLALSQKKYPKFINWLMRQEKSDS